MRIVPLALVLALVAACGEEEPSPKPKPAEDPPALFSGKWLAVRFKDVALAIPVEFTRKVEDVERGQRLFYGPPTNNCIPSIQVIRRPFSKSTRAWFEWWRDKYVRGPRGITKVIEGGPAMIGGRSGYELVYQLPGDGDHVYVTIAWLWVENGQGYIVRGLAEKQAFVMMGFRDLFVKVKDTVRLMP